MSPRSCENLSLFRLDQLFSSFERALLNMDVLKRGLAVHMSELRHHDFERNTSFSAKSSERMPKVMETKPLHAATLDQLSPGFDPCSHGLCYIPLRLCLFREMPRFSDVHRQ